MEATISVGTSRKAMVSEDSPEWLSGQVERQVKELFYEMEFPFHGALLQIRVPKNFFAKLFHLSEACP